MLIDDDFDDQELFGHALKHLDVSVDFVTANDGVHAIEKLKNDPNLNPYFIFVDLDMPRMNGVECIVEIKKISRVKNVPVYLYSTYADPKTIKASRKSGAVDTVVKAHNMKELEQTLAKILPTK
jgi:CheY-like chemotaxis protein